MKQRMISKVSIAGLVLVLLPLSGSFVFAQSATGISSNSVAPDISLVVYPQNPAPGAAISIQVQSYNINLQEAVITWYVNGAKVDAGIGKTSYSTTAGAEGSSMTVTVDVTTAAGQTIEQNTVINPTGVDLIWQAHSYIPAFYEGKALFPYEGEVVIAAVPDFTSNSQNAIYTWTINGVVMGAQSGYGKDTYTYDQGVIVRPVTVDVTVSSLDNTVTAENSITIPAEAPQILFYQDDPVYGVLLNNALTDFTLNAQQIKITAQPYFFDSSAESSAENDDSLLTYNWSINGSNLDPSQNGKNFLVLQKPAAAGQTMISLQATNSSKILQFTDSNLTVNY